MKIFAVIVAAGTGSRTGRTTPKQFEALAGKPVYRWSADQFAAHERISKIVIVAPPDNCETISSLPGGDHVLVTSGGPTRSASVLNGIAALQADDDDIVLIHDAARPGLSDDVIDALIEALSDFDAAAPALPVSDALKRQKSGQLRDVSREALYRVQTPQAFRAGMIRQALANREQDFVDDLAAVEALGARVKLTPGREQLHKITFEDDFALVEKFMAEDAPGTMKIGSGFDVHALVEGDGVTLCGVNLPYSHSLSGHSDADVGWHALTDAIFGALALGDLGDHFPPTDETWKGADSAVFLQHAIRLASEKGWALSNCDITLICEAPKVKPHRQTMRERTREITGLDIDSISIKATTTEGLGFAGRREGIAAQAVVMLSRSRNS